MNTVRISTASIDALEGARTIPWPDANQAFLTREFTDLRRRLNADDTASDGAGPNDFQYPLRLEPPSAIDQLSAIFGLSTFERQILLLAAGIELDSILATRCKQALGDDHRTNASITFSLALGLLDDPHWSALAPTAPLRRYRLIELEPGQGLTNAALRIDERILHYLAGINHLDARLAPLLRTRKHPHLLADEHTDVADDVIRAIDLSSVDAPLLHLCGDDPRGQEDVAAVVARHAGRELFILPIENLANGVDAANSDPASTASQFLSLWTREAALLPAALLIQCGAHAPTASLRPLIERLPRPLMIASRDPLRLNRASQRHDVCRPLPASQKRLWTKALGGLDPAEPTQAAAPPLEPIINALAEQFRLSAETITAVCAGLGAATPCPHEHLAERLWTTCRSLSRPRLEDLAQRIVSTARWEDLILPEMQKATLHQLCAQARQRLTVYESWGFAARGRRGLGISALFAGASGTGKTLAAEVIARELHLDLFRIDLSAVVSKYIGESEKNLKQVFDAAEEGGVLLLFDEADALFGKRAEVKDSHDRYANIEVSYLLQRMESFQGIAVLTTNFKSSLDKAFQRRLRFSIDFPFPGPKEREDIWRRVFPEAAPTENLDIERLAQLNMTGGNIRNIALNAAFLAAEDGGAIGMRHVLQATRQEAIKTERPLAESEIRGWA